MTEWEYETSILCLHGRTSSPIKHMRGTRQGDPISPILFRWVLEDALEDTIRIYRTNKWGVQIRNEWVDVVTYADDCIIMAHDPTAMQHMITTFERILHDCGLELSMTKSEYITTACDAHISLRDGIIPRADRNEMRVLRTLVRL